MKLIYKHDRPGLHVRINKKNNLYRVTIIFSRDRKKFYSVIKEVVGAKAAKDFHNDFINRFIR